MIEFKGIIIAGTNSGCGKTTVALGLMASFVRRGFKVAPFKVGPDFIDPGHHFKVTGAVSRNLDGWMLSKAYNLAGINKAAETADIAVVEGVMGLFDGYDGKSEAGSTAQMAKWTDLPIILVVNAKSMARSAAALVKGFELFDKELKFAGLIFNNIGSSRHLVYLKEALEGNVKMPCLGGIRHDPEITIPERHLGLVTRHDHSLSAEEINNLADLVDKNINVNMLLDILPDIDFHEKYFLPVSSSQIIDKVRIAAAKDNAFCFYYQDNLDMLEACGAQLIDFSPVQAKNLPQNIDGIYLGGGYPELFARQIADNSDLRKEVKRKSMQGMPLYGECGGFMYLCREIIDKDGEIYPMTGCFPFTASMSSGLQSLGYREITLVKDTIIGKCGQIIRGHEFHYSKITGCPKDENIETIYRVSNRAGLDMAAKGFQIFRTLGSYIHLHFGSRPEAARQFIDACIDYRRKRRI